VPRPTAVVSVAIAASGAKSDSCANSSYPPAPVLAFPFPPMLAALKHSLPIGDQVAA